MLKSIRSFVGLDYKKSFRKEGGAPFASNYYEHITIICSMIMISSDTQLLCGKTGKLKVWPNKFFGVLGTNDAFAHPRRNTRKFF